MPIGIAATWIVLAVVLWGRKLHQEELRTGKEPRAFSYFLIVLGVPWAVIWLWFQDHPFWGGLQATLTGVLIGAGAAYFAGRLLHLLRQEPRQ